MELTRRHLMRSLRSGLVLSAASSVPLLAASRPPRVAIALLVPLTGTHAALGTSMQRAALLVQPADAKQPPLMVFDTGGTPAGAAAAAQAALRRKARLILGPLLAAEVRPVLAAVAGKAPVLSFSNDLALRDSGAFLLGITASQTTAAILQYARRRGVRQVALVAGQGGWSAQAAQAALRLQGELGLDVMAAPTLSDPGALQAALRRLAPGGELPDAVLLSDGGPASLGVARALRGSGTQLLGTFQTMDHSPAALGALDGAWLSSPDPQRFGEFARSYETRHGGAPGAITALAYDAAKIADGLRAAGRLDRAGLLAGTSFEGAAGTVRFRSDGTCLRELAILVADAGGYTMVDSSAAA